MFLFLDDAATHGGTIHTDTHNMTFIKMSLVLKRMGITNNKFMLYLSQPDLAKYDPHDLKDPSIELRQRILYEVATNYWYYLREFCRIPQSGENVRYELNRANLAFSWTWLNNIDLLRTQSRQTGKTTDTCAAISWAMHFVYKHSRIGMFAKDSDLVKENVQQIKEIRNAYPKWSVDLSKDIDNREGLSYAKRDTEYKTFIQKSSVKDALKQGRGERHAMQHWEEFAYYKNIRESYESATSASDAASAQVKSRGMPAARIHTTTAGNLADESGKFAFGVKQNACRFHEAMYDLKNHDELVEFLKVNCGTTKLMVYIEYSYLQLGKTEEWFNERTGGRSALSIAIDYLNQWQLGTETSVVPKHILTKADHSIIEPVEFTRRGMLVIKWYKDKSVVFKDRHIPYIIGADTSDNVGNDFTTLVITDPRDMSIVATCKCNLSNMMKIIDCIWWIMNELPKSVFIPERNRAGTLVDILIDRMLAEGMDPISRIYNTLIQDYNGTKNPREANLSDGRIRKMFGFATSSKSRDILYDNVLLSMLEHMASRLHDLDLFEEISALQIINNRVDHIKGGHDDLTIAMLLTGYFIMFGKNHHMYGIPTGTMMCAVGSDGDSIDPYYKAQQLEMLKRIKHLTERLDETKNDMVKYGIMRELKQLEGTIDENIRLDEYKNVDEVKQEQQHKQSNLFTVQNINQWG